MKKITLIILILINQLSFSQRYEATYVMYGKFLTSKPYDAKLTFNNKLAKFIYAIQNAEKDVKHKGSDLTETVYNEDSFLIYTDLKKDSIYEKRQPYNKKKPLFYTYEPILKNKWELFNETKKIGKYNCKKAKIKFRGRTYIAWYTTKIPTRFGPWKLHGLPGLLIEAADNTNTVHFQLTQFKQINNNKNSLKISTKEKLVNIVKYLELEMKKNNKMNKKFLASGGQNMILDRIEKNYFDIKEGLREYDGEMGE